MFLSKIRNSFRRAKNDVSELKKSTNDWVMFLNRNQSDMKVKLYELDKRLRKLESEREIEVYR